MAAFLSIAPYQRNQAISTDLNGASPETVVQLYHETCQGLLNLPQFKDEDFDPDIMVQFVSSLIQARKEEAQQKEQEKAQQQENPDNKAGGVSATQPQQDSDTSPSATPGSTASSSSGAENSPGSTAEAASGSSQEPEASKSRGEKKFDEFSQLFDFEKLIQFYELICKEPKPEAYESLELKTAVAFYLQVVKELPDLSVFERPLPQASRVLDRHGQLISEVFAYRNRREWVSVSEIPDIVQKAFVAIEDKRFFSHNGVDQIGLVRAMVNTMTGSIQGGSSITQQLAKNLFFIDDVEKENSGGRLEDTVRRKIKEFVTAFEIEQRYSKAKILEMYLNRIYMGRSSWGVRTAAKAYFKRDLDELTLSEVAFLAALPRGPNNYEPELYKPRALARRDLVLNAMTDAFNEDGTPFINDGQRDVAKEVEPRFVPPRVSNHALYFTDYLRRLTREDLKVRNFVDDHYTIHSTIDLELQKTTEKALQEQLIQYEIDNGQVEWRGPVNNLARYLEAVDTDGNPVTWQSVARLRLAKYTDVHFPVAVVIGRYKGRRVIGFRDGKTAYLDATSEQITNGQLTWGDVIYVTSTAKSEIPKQSTPETPEGASTGDGKDLTKELTRELTEAPKQGGIYRVLHIPKVQGAAIVYNVHTGDVLAMTGGFSFHTHPYNRATFGLTHPGSVLKPFSYLLALDKGFQPNTRIRNTLTELPKKTGCDSWRVRNATGEYHNQLDMRFCFEQSYNNCVANMIQSLPGGLENVFQDIRDIMKEFRVYEKPIGCYPLVLGAQDTSVYRVARAFAAFANGGYLPKARLFTKITGSFSGEIAPPVEMEKIQTVDDVSMMQINSFMQGVLARGTGVSASELSPYAAGKTGSAQNYRSAWFAGYTNDVSVAVYIGYDKGQNLVDRSSGSRLALPVAQKIFHKSFEVMGRKTELASSNSSSAVQYAQVTYPRPNQRPSAQVNEAFRLGVPSDALVLAEYSQPQRAWSVDSTQPFWRPDPLRPIVPVNRQRPVPGSALPTWDGSPGVPGVPGQYIDDPYFYRRVL